MTLMKFRVARRTTSANAFRLLARVLGVLSIALASFQSPLLVAGAQADQNNPHQSPQSPTSNPKRAEEPFGFQNVVEEARGIAKKPFEPARKIRDQDVRAHSYEQYKTYRFAPSSESMRVFTGPFEVQPLPVGWLYRQAVEIYVVQNGKVDRKTFGSDEFLLTNSRGPKDKPARLSGFRINGYLNSISKLDEIVVFQGATYFRALGRGHKYGLSARGLAINTASRKGEEFPFFKKFWIKKGTHRDTQAEIYALLDSPSVAGAYKFTIQPGEETVMDVELHLFPRKPISSFGLAPLTSMNFVSPAQINETVDFRPRIHDSSGLAIKTSSGERIWRPLVNPHRLELSYFRDQNASEFGLIQRPRAFAKYQDLEAEYHKRPSAWVELKSGFSNGDVTLIEIPSSEEVHDNIVAFWQPDQALTRGSEHKFNLRIRWCGKSPHDLTGPVVSQTLIGKEQHGNKTLYRIIADFVDQGHDLNTDVLPKAKASPSSGRIQNITVQENTATRGVRVAILFEPEGKTSSDIRLNLDRWSNRVPETFIYRWVHKP